MHNVIPVFIQKRPLWILSSSSPLRKKQGRHHVCFVPSPPLPSSCYPGNRSSASWFVIQCVLLPVLSKITEPYRRGHISYCSLVLFQPNFTTVWYYHSKMSSVWQHVVVALGHCNIHPPPPPPLPTSRFLLHPPSVTYGVMWCVFTNLSCVKETITIHGNICTHFLNWHDNHKCLWSLTLDHF